MSQHHLLWLLHFPFTLQSHICSVDIQCSVSHQSCKTTLGALLEWWSRWATLLEELGTGRAAGAQHHRSEVGGVKHHQSFRAGTKYKCVLHSPLFPQCLRQCLNEFRNSLSCIFKGLSEWKGIMFDVRASLSAFPETCHKELL